MNWIKILIWYALNLLTFAVGREPHSKHEQGHVLENPKLSTKVLLWDASNRMRPQNLLLNKSSSEAKEGRPHC